MTPIRCPVCTTYNHVRAVKLGSGYCRCAQCQSIYTLPAVQDGQLGGSGERVRNEVNHERILRIKALGCRSLLDFGCGHGWLVEAASKGGMRAAGYDRYALGFATLPAEQFDCVSLIEVVEHLYTPFSALDSVRDCLLPNGFVYVETTFANFIEIDALYVDPSIGHHLIFSTRALDHVMLFRNLAFYLSLNQNVRIYRKQSDHA